MGGVHSPWRKPSCYPHVLLQCCPQCLAAPWTNHLLYLLPPPPPSNFLSPPQDKLFPDKAFVGAGQASQEVGTRPGCMGTSPGCLSSGPSSLATAWRSAPTHALAVHWCMAVTLPRQDQHGEHLGVAREACLPSLETRYAGMGLCVVSNPGQGANPPRPWPHPFHCSVLPVATHTLISAGSLDGTNVVGGSHRGWLVTLRALGGLVPFVGPGWAAPVLCGSRSPGPVLITIWQ